MVASMGENLRSEIFAMAQNEDGDVSGEQHRRVDELGDI